MKLKIAEKQTQGEGYVTLQTLRHELKTKAWKDLDNPKSSLSKFLLSSAFKSKGLEHKKIDTELLLVYAILNCQGIAADKAEHVYNII